MHISGTGLTVAGGVIYRWCRRFRGSHDYSPLFDFERELTEALKKSNTPMGSLVGKRTIRSRRAIFILKNRLVIDVLNAN